VLALVAAGWGAIAASSLVIGALIAIFRPVHRRPLGVIMAFGAGVLLSSVAYELVEEAVAVGGQLPMALGLASGACVFFAGDRFIDRLGAAGMGTVAGPSSPNAGLAIVLGAALDGIPESIVLGLTLLGGSGVSVAFVAAVFISNLPEGLAASIGLRASGWTTGRIVALWSGVTLVSAFAALAGFALFDSAPPSTVAFVLAFAGGAVLTMLADTMMPEAFDKAGPLVGLFTTAGFSLAFALHLIE
jgi:zinc transporter, ZIP family